jgi:hypothetical protein
MGTATLPSVLPPCPKPRQPDAPISTWTLIRTARGTKIPFASDLTDHKYAFYQMRFAFHLELLSGPDGAHHRT